MNISKGGENTYSRKKEHQKHLGMVVKKIREPQTLLEKKGKKGKKGTKAI